MHVYKPRAKILFYIIVILKRTVMPTDIFHHTHSYIVVPCFVEKACLHVILYTFYALHADEAFFWPVLDAGKLPFAVDVFIIHELANNSFMSIYL